MDKFGGLCTVVALAVGMAAGAVSAQAQDAEIAKYPVDRVTLVTHSKEGGGGDIFLRELGKHLGPKMGVEFVVQNVVGGSSAKAMQMVAQSPADGSVLYGTTPTFINTSLLSKPQFTYKDLQPIANFFIDPQIFYVRSDSPFATLAEAIAFAKANPGKGKWGVTSAGSTGRQIVERLKAREQLDIILGSHDAGSEVLISVLNGSVDIGVGEVQEVAGQVAAGEVRMVAVLTDERLESHPDLPTAQEQGIDLVVKKFRGLAGPKGLSPEVLAIWAQAIPALLEDPEYKAKYLEDSIVPAFMDSADYAVLIDEFAKETEEYYREAGIVE